MRFQQQFSRIVSSRFLRSAGTISGGTAVAQIIAFAAAPILTRLYTPESYGVLALMLSFVMLGVTIASLHYELAIALPKREEDAASLTLLAVLLGAAFSALSLVLLAPGLINLLGRAGFTTLLPYWWLLPGTLFATAIYQALIYWHLRRQRYREVAMNGVVQSLMQNGSPILFATLGFSGIGLLLGLALSRVVAASGFLWRAVRLDRAVFAPNFGEMWRLAREYKTFPTLGLAGAVLHMACFHLPPFLLTGLYDASVAGFYMLQDRVLGVPLAVLAQGLASVFYVDAARLAQDDPEGLKRSYLKLLRNLTLAGILPALLLVMTAPWVFKTVFGAQWEIAGKYAQIMAVPTLLRFIAGPLFRCLTILKRQGWIFVCDGIGLLAIFTLPQFLADGGIMGLAGIKAVAVGISLSYTGLLVAATLAVCRNARKAQPMEPGTDLETRMPAET